MRQKKFILQENEIPTHWYNIQADMPNKPLPPLNPATHKPLDAEDLSHIFNKECSKQELDVDNAWIEIPEEVREKYTYYRSTPLVRAYALEEALGTPAHIYFKNESTNPLGSHKINSAIPQCYYCKQEGDTNVTTETGAGQWGAALSYAAKLYGLEAAVYQVKISMQQKPYRSAIMRTFGATVEGSPSMSTRAGKDIITREPNHPGSLGTAISEAIELATTTPKCKYTLGSVLNHVALHQTVIGLEAEKQMEMAGEYPDTVIACFGGGSNFGGIAFPFMRHNIKDGKTTEFIAAEPESCPKLTRGKFEYDFGDEAGYTPLLPMYTLGHDFKPANIHAGGLRYHGAGMIISQLIRDKFMHGVDIPQLESFEASMIFARAEGIIPAPESGHAIASVIREAKKAKEEGKEKVILFCLSGHGLIDMTAYESYINGDLNNYSISDSEIEKNLEDVPQIEINDIKR
ncbi:MAG: TrpB-like pyridoxal phosphate-dependent enzyme [Prevotella sp.]|jgi:tryptophan synthase beta chain|nr:TrpB-like pyridoxal phosphate-dependent enzyme [Prevotella sp.]MBP9985121.1 TrpB-like pyridoxal phosphate-dependent enzyme [Prevotella sp.]MDY0153797.1 TrpB-like pyridoxal phosphate-dependent enzyme [Prevotella sp.]